MASKKLPAIYAARDELNWKKPSSVTGAIKKIIVRDTSHYQKADPLVDRLAADFLLPKDRIFLSHGAEGAINQVFSATGKSTVLLPEFGYSLYFDVARANKADIKTFKFQEKSDSFYYDVPDMLYKLKHVKPSLLVLIDPESPLGFSTKNNDLVAILKSASACKIVVLDQAHEGIRAEHIKNIKQLLESHPNLLVVRSFSKLYGLANLRVGYAICGEAAIQALRLPSNRLGFPSIQQEIAIAALDAGAEYHKIAAEVREQKARFNSEIQKLGGYKIYLTDHLSCVVKVPENYEKTLMQLADSSNIEIRNLTSYHAGLAHLYRVTVGAESVTNRLIGLFRDAAKQIGK